MKNAVKASSITHSIKKKHKRQLFICFVKCTKNKQKCLYFYNQNQFHPTLNNHEESSQYQLPRKTSFYRQAAQQKKSVVLIFLPTFMFFLSMRTFFVPQRKHKKTTNCSTISRVLHFHDSFFFIIFVLERLKKCNFLNKQ